ncbi:zf-DHHC-domain-containing protein [Rhodofomes roseus]|uniref:Palmitoyltransferase n=1 Tax=Rhodofomes roseus TaxID=34475 RepID=A0ABQ8JZA2_9APHY|nr:zf-DHHC-domain-containing protein [Rhodofomes roseus]KAH9829635.1 zf-DHHC-domain-containing protein [Rhodofomes roseus]
MTEVRRNTLLHLPDMPAPRTTHWDDEDEDDASPRGQKRWFHYIPVLLAVLLMLIPHPSLLLVLVNYHLRVLKSPARFLFHLLATYTLTFLAFSSLILILARDPGPVTSPRMAEAADSLDEREDMSFMQALLATEEDDKRPGNWCRKCSAPKPERTHHCSTCGRCVLKMDHHCYWLGDRCIGHRTYAAFIHLLTCIVFLSVYIAVLCVQAVYFAFTNPLAIDENTPLHDIYLAFYGIIMALVFGSFWMYHIYLTTTNQTTLENVSPFLLLRHLPPLPRPPPDAQILSDPPLEHQLSHAQRRLVRDAHFHIRAYDVGWRKNWAQVMGWDRPWGWVPRLLVGGGCKGDGQTFPRNPRADDMLARLADELVSIDKD